MKTFKKSIPKLDAKTNTFCITFSSKYIKIQKKHQETVRVSQKTPKVKQKGAKSNEKGAKESQSEPDSGSLWLALALSGSPSHI